MCNAAVLHCQGLGVSCSCEPRPRESHADAVKVEKSVESDRSAVVGWTRLHWKSIKSMPIVQLSRAQPAGRHSGMRASSLGWH